MTRLFAAILVFGLTVFAVVGEPVVQAESAPEPEISRPAGVPGIDHVIWIWFENREYSAITAASAPYFASLAATYVNYTGFHGITHPSQPNYLHAFAGSNLGVTTNNYCTFPVPEDSLPQQLSAAGKSWRVYAQNYPGGCSDVVTFTGPVDGWGAAGNYDRKHNPAIAFEGTRLNPAECANMQPLANFDPLVNFAFVVPNNINSMHDGSRAQGDAFLQAFAPQVFNSPDWAHTLFIISFDEGTTNINGGGQIYTVAAAPWLTHSDPTTFYNHHSALRTIEEIFGLPYLGGAATSTTMTEVFPPAATPTNTATDTPTDTPTYTPTDTPTNTATATATNTPTSTSTYTPTPCESPGSLDTSFDGDGIVSTLVSVNAVAIQSNGRIVVGGGPGFSVAQYNANGTIDASFGSSGVATAPINGTATSIAIQSDGKIVQVGYLYNGLNNDFAVVRYNIDGSLDTSFDTDGIVITPIHTYQDDEKAYSVAIQPFGQILVAGIATYFYLGGQGTGFTIVAYNTDGSVGYIEAPILQSHGEGAYAVAIDPLSSNRVAVGYSIDNCCNGQRYGAVLGNGTTIIGFGTSSSFSSVAIQADGRIVAAGSSDTNPFTVVRYNSNLSLDTTFDGDGIVNTPVGGGASSIAIQTDGKIVVVGGSLVRYNSDGTLDTTFDGDGIVSSGGGASVAIQTDGKIVVANGSSIFRYNGAGCTSPTATPTDTPTNTPTPPAAVTGMVTYGNAIGPPSQRFVSNVAINGVGSSNVSATTDFPNGSYSLTGFGSGAYTVTPSKTASHSTAISSFDAAKIAQYVASLTTFSPAQQTVADASGNSTISSFDAALVAGYAVGGDGGSAGSWRFNPVSRAYPSITTDMTGEDYSALLMGEVSGNWQNTGARAANCGSPTVREGDRFNVECTALTDVRASATDGTSATDEIRVTLPHSVDWSGKEIVVPVVVDSVAEKGIISYEFDLRYDPTVIQPTLDTVDVAGTVSRGLSVVVNSAEPGLLRVAVYGAMPIEEDGVLLNLRFTPVGTLGAISPLTWERIIFNDGEPAVMTIDGTVELAGDGK